jgi:hypothetical protein
MKPRVLSARRMRIILRPRRNAALRYLDRVDELNSRPEIRAAVSQAVERARSQLGRLPRQELRTAESIEELPADECDH